MNVVPAILPHSFEELTEKLSRIEGLTPLVQIDICDGIFGLEKTWIPNIGEVLPSGFQYEIDIMVHNWSTCIQSIIPLGVTKVVLHVDHMTDDEIRSAVLLLKENAILTGIAVSNDVAIETHIQALRIAKEIDYHVYAQVMGITRIGEQGQPFDESAVTRIILLKQQIGDVEVQVDGAMNPSNAPKVIQAGAATVIVGSYLFKGGEPSVAYEEMVNIPSVCE